MPTAKKAAVIEDLTEKLSRINAAALIEYRGLTVAEIGELRGQLRQQNIELQVTKNTLLREAAHRNNLTDLDDLFAGPTAVAFIYDDEAAATKALNAFFRTARVGEIKSGILKGGRKVSAEQFAKLADLPNRATLLAQIAGLLESPMSQLAALFNAPAQQLAYALAAFEDKGGAEGAGITASAAPVAEAPAETPTAQAAPEAAVAEPAPEAAVAEAAEAPVAETATAPEEAAETPAMAAETTPAEAAAADASSAPESEGGAANQAQEPAPADGGEPVSGQEAAADVSYAPESEGSADAQP